MACPRATQDLELNTKNRDSAVKAEHIQYGPLNEKVNVHKSVIAILKRYKLLNKNQELINTCSSASSSVKDNDKDKDKEEFKGIVKDIFEDWWNLYDKKIGKAETYLYWKKNVNCTLNGVIMDHTKKYIQIEKKFRKDPIRYLKKKTYLDEVV